MDIFSKRLDVVAIEFVSNVVSVNPELLSILPVVLDTSSFKTSPFGPMFKSTKIFHIHI